MGAEKADLRGSSSRMPTRLAQVSHSLLRMAPGCSGFQSLPEGASAVEAPELGGSYSLQSEAQQVLRNLPSVELEGGF